MRYALRTLHGILVGLLGLVVASLLMGIIPPWLTEARTVGRSLFTMLWPHVHELGQCGSLGLLDMSQHVEPREDATVIVEWSQAEQCWKLIGITRLPHAAPLVTTAP